MKTALVSSLPRTQSAAASVTPGAQTPAVPDATNTLNLDATPDGMDAVPLHIGQARVALDDTGAAEAVGQQVLKTMGEYGPDAVANTDGLLKHLDKVADELVGAAKQAAEPGSVFHKLQAKFPGAQIQLVGTASQKARDQVYFRVREPNGETRAFNDTAKRLSKIDLPSDAVFLTADVSGDGFLTVKIPDVRSLMDPTLAPSYGVGRVINVRMGEDWKKQIRNTSDTVNPEYFSPDLYRETLPGTAKGEDGKPASVMLYGSRDEKGTITAYDGHQTYTVQVTHPDGSVTSQHLSEAGIRKFNDPFVYDVNNSQYDDVTIDAKKDKPLADFLKEMKGIAQRDIPASGTAEQKAAGQRQALIDMTTRCNAIMSYPDETPNTTDVPSQQYTKLVDAHSNWNPVKLGDLIKIGRGVCRHQAIIMQLACQEAGITSRTVTATANTADGQFRGYHAFLMATLDDGQTLLVDPTWYDAGPLNVQGRTQYGPPGVTGTPFWDTQYQNKRRVTLNDDDQPEHQYVDATQVGFKESNDPVIDATGNVVEPAPAPSP